MALNHNDDEKSPLMQVLLDVVRESFRDAPQDPNVPRDSFLWRWAKFLSLIVVPAVLVGGGFVCEQYIVWTHGETWLRRERARVVVRQDRWESMRFRFIAGAGVGGGLGAIYVIRFLVRRVDP